MKKKCLITFGVNDKCKEDIEALGYEVFYEKESSIEFKPYMEEVEILVCYNPFEKLDISKMKALKWIQLSSVGFDQLPKDYIKDLTITNNKGGYGIPMGEWIILNILELYKRRPYAYRNKEKRKWHMDFKVREIFGKTIGFIGTGAIAKEAARRLQGFSTKVIGVNTKGTQVEFFNSCYAMKDLNKVLSESDVIVVTLPYTEETHHCINKDKLNMMKDDAVFINVSRGAIVKEEDLIQHLESGKLLGAALDVFEEEPLKENSPLWDIDNVVITCHNSWISEVMDDRRWELYFENLKRYSEGRELLNLVNISRGY
ncbi:phosphoglycerate dehydrogenase [Clostridium sp.]|uniref:phosphoglycerate dehydrogenase n=1 Tax=Clostridium sp. TaxID=1506 RepID=UPI0034639A82